MTFITQREREPDRLACKAFSSLPTIRDIMGLVMGIPVRARKSRTRSQIAFLLHVSFLATSTAAAFCTQVVNSEIFHQGGKEDNYLIQIQIFTSKRD